MTEILLKKNKNRQSSITLTIYDILHEQFLVLQYNQHTASPHVCAGLEMIAAMPGYQLGVQLKSKQYNP